MANPLERTHYFLGQSLTAADYDREQQYLLTRLRNHHRFAHGWGVLTGLQVHIDGKDVVVQPRVAIDCEGNELHLDAEHRSPLPRSTAPFFVGIQYVEELAAPMPGVEGDQYGIVVERAEINMAPTNAAQGHAKLGPGTPGCGQRHALVLARARLQEGVWQLKSTKRSA
jgi:hypothetical protein